MTTLTPELAQLRNLNEAIDLLREVRREKVFLYGPDWILGWTKLDNAIVYLDKQAARICTEAGL